MTSPTKPDPVVFIHGPGIHRTTWRPRLKLFESAAAPMRHCRGVTRAWYGGAVWMER